MIMFFMFFCVVLYKDNIRTNCPNAVKDLKYLKISYIGYNEKNDRNTD